MNNCARENKNRYLKITLRQSKPISVSSYKVFWNRNHYPFKCKCWSIHLYIHHLADTFLESCATWWKLGYLEKSRFHFWWLAIHMKMSIKFSPSKVLIKKFMGRSFWIRYLLPCIFCFYVSFFFSIWFRFSHWLNRHAAMTLEKLMNGFETCFTPRPHSIKSNR